MGADPAVTYAFKDTPRLLAIDRRAWLAMEQRVSGAYHPPWSHHQSYEFDDRVPRCLGGLDAAANLWLQPLKEEIEKDALGHRLGRAACTMHTIDSAGRTRNVLGNQRAYLR